jgi:hypothetical protein
MGKDSHPNDMLHAMARPSTTLNRLREGPAMSARICVDGLGVMPLNDRCIILRMCLPALIASIEYSLDMHAVVTVSGDR